jgi:beta-lactamase class A
MRKSNLTTLILVTFLFISSSICAQNADLQSKIEKIIQSKKANIGFAMLGIETEDSLSINGQAHYPMQSVFKFHLALAVLKQVDIGKLKLEQHILIEKKDLLPDTWSPMRDKYPGGNVYLELNEILTYTVSQSDNNGCDILFRLIGGTGKVSEFIKSYGIADVSIVATEEEMHKSYDIQFKNWTTTCATVHLLKKFYKDEIISKYNTKFLWQIMIETNTGTNRIKGLLPEGTKVGHKTGSSGQENGITAAFNDIGIVTLPNGKHFAIAVYITDSKEDDETNAAIVAEISKAVWDFFCNR